MSTAYLGLGSNLGDRLQNLRAAVGALDAHPDVVVVAKSSVYASEPVGMTDQPEFLNAVVAVETSLDAHSMLTLAQEIEKRLGRKRGIRWGPRTLDIDLLLFCGLEISNEVLEVPHPRIAQRRFVLEPLLEIAPDALMPDGTSMKELLRGLEGGPWTRREGEMTLDESSA